MGTPPAAMKFRKVLVPAEEIARSQQPVLYEPCLLREDRGSFHPDLHVTPFVNAGGVSQPVVGDSGAARECDAAVDDQGFPMVAPVRAMQRVPVDRPKPCNFAAASRQNLKYLASERGRTDGIEEKFDANPFPGLNGKCFGEPASHLAIPEDVLFHRDRKASRLDCLQHSRIELIPVVVNPDAVTSHQRHAGGACHGGSEFGRIGFEVRIESVHGGVGRGREIIEDESP